jgi:hypothetical protein
LAPKIFFIIVVESEGSSSIISNLSHTRRETLKKEVIHRDIRLSIPTRTKRPFPIDEIV